MKKTDELVKLSGTTVYFPRVEASLDELKLVYCYGHARPSFLREIVINIDDVEMIIKAYKKERPSEKEGFLYLLNQYRDKTDVLLKDLELFSEGKIDLIDFIFKYGVSYKKLKTFFKTLLVDIDVDSYWKKHKKFVQEKTTQKLYGVHHTALLYDVREKRETTLLNKYGVSNVMVLDEFKKKQRETMKSRYGYESNFLVKDSVKVFQKTMFQTLCDDSTWRAFLTHLACAYCKDFNETLLSEIYDLKCRDFVVSELENDNVERLLRDWKTFFGQKLVYPNNKLFSLKLFFSKPWLSFYKNLDLLECDEQYLLENESFYELMVKAYLDELKVSYIRNAKKPLNGLELDFYLPECKLAIEVNPSITHHSNSFFDYGYHNSLKAKDYHYKKYRLCEKKGITLIHLFEWDLTPLNFERFIKPHLKALICGYHKRFGARVIKLALVTNTKHSRKFLDLYHKQGSGRANYYYEFSKDDELLGVASFVKSRLGYELKRLCFKPDVQIIGGLSKVVKRFMADFNVSCVYSYSDNNYGNGMSYKKAGFQFLKETGPSLMYVARRNGSDTYSWQVGTPWSMTAGVIKKDKNFNHQTKNPKEYVECYLSHKLDGGKGYDSIYTAGSKLWVYQSLD